MEDVQLTLRVRLFRKASQRSHTQNAHASLEKWDFPLPALSAWDLLSVYCAYFPNRTVNKSPPGSDFPAQNSYMQFLTMLRGILPGNLGDRLYNHPSTQLRHPGNGYFLQAIFSSSDVCLGLKKKEGLAVQLWFISAVNVKLMLTKAFYTWFPSVVLWEGSTVLVNRAQMPLGLLSALCI